MKKEEVDIQGSDDKCTIVMVKNKGTTTISVYSYDLLEPITALNKEISIDLDGFDVDNIFIASTVVTYNYKTYKGKRYYSYSVCPVYIHSGKIFIYNLNSYERICNFTITFADR